MKIQHLFKSLLFIPIFISNPAHSQKIGYCVDTEIQNVHNYFDNTKCDYGDDIDAFVINLKNGMWLSDKLSNQKGSGIRICDNFMKGDVIKACIIETYDCDRTYTPIHYWQVINITANESIVLGDSGKLCE